MRNKRALSLPKEEEQKIELDLISSYEGLVRRIVLDSIREFGAFTLDFDDLYQEGMIALLHAGTKYMDRGEAEFITYAYKAIKNRVIRNANLYKKIYEYESVSYSENPRKYECLFADSEYQEIDYEGELADFTKNLNKNDQMILMMYLQGRSYAEIATILNTKIKRIDNRLHLIKKKLYSYYKAHYEH